LDLLKILEKDPENIFNKDSGLDKFDWNSNEKCLEIFRNFVPFQDDDLPVNHPKLVGHTLIKKITREPKQELKTIIEEDSMKTVKKLRVFEKINSFHKNQFIFKNSFSEFSMNALSLKSTKKENNSFD